MYSVSVFSRHNWLVLKSRTLGPCYVTLDIVLNSHFSSCFFPNIYICNCAVFRETYRKLCNSCAPPAGGDIIKHKCMKVEKKLHVTYAERSRCVLEQKAGMSGCLKRDTLLCHFNNLISSTDLVKYCYPLYENVFCSKHGSQVRGVISQTASLIISNPLDASSLFFLDHSLQSNL